MAHWIAWRRTWAEAMVLANALAVQTRSKHWVRFYDGEWRIGWGDPKR
jgi:hypothetical protein